MTTKELKYVVSDKHEFIMFNPSMTHRDVSRGLEGKVVGAGFLVIKTESKFNPGSHDLDINRIVISVRCHGESTSLGIKSRPEDEKLINNNLNYY